MAKCIIGDKLLRKCARLLPAGYAAVSGVVRGGWKHGVVLVFAHRIDGENVMVEVDHITGKVNILTRSWA